MGVSRLQDMSVFRFKYFSVANKDSAMKVNTDGVLLGALMTIRPEDRTYLDVGTGTGTIALMAAQRVSSLFTGFPAGDGAGIPADISVLAIDIDGPSARESAANFAASPWPGMLRSVHSSLEDFRKMPYCRGFDRIFSNPPYYDLSLEAPDGRRNAARHESSLSYRELLAFSSEYLSGSGMLSLVLPAGTTVWLLRHARMYGLHLSRMVRIRTTSRKEPSRIVAEFTRTRPLDAAPETLLTLMDGGSYTREYVSLTGDFYLWQE